MSGQWKPGDVAMALVTWDNAPAFRKAKGESDVTTKPAFRSEGWWVFGPTTRIPVGDEMAVRPLVVLDPEDAEAVARLADIVDEWWGRVPYSDMRKDGDLTTATAMQAALREFANPTPAKPDEPQGLGAVVRDESGVEYIHLGSGLWAYGTTDGPSHGYTWPHVHAVEVLSEGVIA